jgi:DNA-binding transcriptional MocR family regulator
MSLWDSFDPRERPAVAVEVPTYSRVIDLLRLSNSKIFEVPMSPEGMERGETEEGPYGLTN